ncbi:RNA polymerase subunit sigma-24 [Arachidicoccus ginsenosidimutans]|uniref:RNA polymerase sigma factor n=1 Tax=Arachidicoccus sp. BS20 TaxID=1850526 RepID=UPI0007F0C229|nr:sigma-70 family RNA polymerase sigma factor [Arachidicoccus sp. BS20]ANI88428.1 RNA polymerase subunit sigma-24 [Arachidicoccus sp. BS20]
MEHQLSDILSGCRQEIPAWQKILYERYYGFAYSVCMRYTSNNEDAIETMNDGFVKIFKGVAKFTEPEDNTNLPKAFMGWVKTIMINTSINHAKSVARKISWTATDDAAQNIASHQHSPISDISYTELVKMVQRLSPAYRNTFSLYAIEGFSHEEIAGILGISVGTSKSNLLKARKNLRKILDKTYAEKV